MLPDVPGRPPCGTMPLPPRHLRARLSPGNACGRVRIAPRHGLGWPPFQPGSPLDRRQPDSALQDLVQRFALDMLHDDVRGAVSLNVPVYPYDAWMSKAVDGPRLLQEAVEAPGEDIVFSTRCRHSRPCRPDGRVRGKVLLDSDRSIQVVVEREVGDAEAARTEHADDFALVDPKTRWERVHGSDSTSGDPCCRKHSNHPGVPRQPSKTARRIVTDSDAFSSARTNRPPPARAPRCMNAAASG